MRWEIALNPEPDPIVESWLDYMSELGKTADSYYFYIGPANKKLQGGVDDAS